MASPTPTQRSHRLRNSPTPRDTPIISSQTPARAMRRRPRRTHRADAPNRYRLVRRGMATLLVAHLLTVTPVSARYYDPNSKACDLVAKQALAVGWPKRELKNVRRVAARESLCSTAAFNKRDPWGGSRGYMQLNGSNVGWLKRSGIINNAEDLHHPLKNLRAALALWKLYGWRPWAGSSIAP